MGTVVIIHSFSCRHSRHLAPFRDYLRIVVFYAANYSSYAEVVNMTSGLGKVPP